MVVVDVIEVGVEVDGDILFDKVIDAVGEGSFVNVFVEAEIPFTFGEVEFESFDSDEV